MFQTGIDTFEKEPPPQPVVYHPPPPQPKMVNECNIIDHKQKPFWIPNWMNNNQINPNNEPNMMYFGTEGEENPSNVERYQRPCWNNRCILSIGIIFAFIGIAILICHFIEGCDLLVQCNSKSNTSSHYSSSNSFGSSSFSSSKNHSSYSSSSSLFNCI